MSVSFGSFPVINGTILSVYLAVFTSVIVIEVPDSIAIAQAQVDETTPPNEPENPLFDEQQDANDPIPSVSQLSDLKPADWAFQALKSLNQRYGCIAGYPDNTYLGNRVLSRYELVAGLNGC